MPVIYLVKLNGIPKYVGFTTQKIKNRWYQHCYNSLKGSNSILHNAIRKYGPESFTIEEIYSDDDAKILLNEKEEQFIRLYNTHKDYGDGYNMTFGGDGLINPCMEVRNKISESNRKRKGKRGPPSPETRIKLSNALKGRKPSEATTLGFKKYNENRKK